MKKLVIIVVFTLFATVLIIFIVLLSPHREIKFYYSILSSKVARERKLLSEQIYDDHTSNISQMLVAEDSRSEKVIRFVFISEERWDNSVQQDILNNLNEYMKSLYYGHFPHTWEVFFCEKSKLQDIYVSNIIYNGQLLDGTFKFVVTDWYAVPKTHVDTTSFESLELMLHRIQVAMYWNGSIYKNGVYYPDGISYDEQIPDIPTA
jgi:hypothetical protein